jgi:hypothetical protein
MKVCLDDERQTPEGWIRVYWSKEALVAMWCYGLKKQL